MKEVALFVPEMTLIMTDNCIGEYTCIGLLYF